MNSYEVDGFVDWLAIAVFAGLVPGFIAYLKGYGFYLWWVYGMCLFPIALLHVLYLKKDENYLRARKLLNN